MMRRRTRRDDRNAPEVRESQRPRQILFHARPGERIQTPLIPLAFVRDTASHECINAIRAR